MQSAKGFVTQPNQTLAQLGCKLVASIESSNESYSAESKVQEYFHFGQAPPMPFQQQSFIKHNFNKLDKLQEQLNNIDKLKYNYQSRNQRFKNMNTQNSQKSRSIEKKHLLKPSQTPNFVKRFDTNRQEEETRDSSDKIQSSLNQSNVRSEISEKKTSSEIKSAQFYQLSIKYSQLQQELKCKNRIIDTLNQTISQLKHNKERQNYSNGNLHQQNRILKLDCQNIKLEKQQLETILKDLLFERERERLFGHSRQLKESSSKTPVSHSNVVSSRKSFTPNRSTLTKPSPRGENVNNNFFIEKMERQSGNKTSHRQRDRVKANRQALEEISINEEQKVEKEIKQIPKKGGEESKKMKVQSILDKLKIKINKT